MTKNPKNNTNVLSDVEYASTVDSFNRLISVTCSTMGKAYEQKITTHLQSIASSDALVLTNPTALYNNTKQINTEAALVKFYKQLEFLLLSTRTNGYPDFYVRLCNNLVAGLVNNQPSDYGISTNGGILDLAKQLYRKSFLEYFIKPTDQKVLRVFLMNHPHLVLQLLLSQFYQHASTSKNPV